MIMTLSEHIDALDQMVTLGATVPQLRSQIAFIGREVATLEAENANLALRLSETNGALLKLKTPEKRATIELRDCAPLPEADYSPDNF